MRRQGYHRGHDRQGEKVLSASAYHGSGRQHRPSHSHTVLSDESERAAPNPVTVTAREDQNSDQQTEPPSKRRRVALACTVCRARKSRCDGTRPKCSLCVELGFDCQYQQSSSYANVIIGKDYLLSIENELKLVESRLSSLEKAYNQCTACPPPAIPLTTAPVHPDGGGEDAVDSGQPLGTASLQAESLEGADTIEEEDSVDAMGAVTFLQEEDCAFFGPSSNIALLRHVSRAIARLSQDPRPWMPSPGEQQDPRGFLNAGAFFNVSRPSSPPPPTPHGREPHPVEEKVNIYALPPDAEARELLRRYFNNTGLLFPYIHEKSFMETFEQVRKDNFKGVRRTWLALLNMVFAHAVVHLLEPSTTPGSVGIMTLKPTSESEVYCKRASGLCSEQIANGRGTSTEVVQFLLLMGQYLTGTQKSVQTWKTHGQAVRAAFQLGLHSSDLARIFSPLEQEIRKKTWYGCVYLDRTLSMTFGRPPSIPENYVHLALPVEYSTLQEGTGPAERRESLSIAFFNGTITLYRVLYTIVEQLYGNNLACSFATATATSSAVDTVARVYKIENQLSEWQRRLPPQLKLITADDIRSDYLLPPEEDAAEEDWRQLRLRFILTLRYTNVRLLLHRPVLIKFLNILDGVGSQQISSEDSQSDRDDMSLLQQVGAANVQIAIKSAKEIILLVHHALHSAAGRSKWGLLGAWWFSLYYSFNAALMLGACILINVDRKASAEAPGGSQSLGVPLQPDPSTQDMSLHLGMAVEILKDLDNGNRMVARCQDYLEQFVQVVQALAIGQGLLPAQTNEWRAAAYSPFPPPSSAPAFNTVPPPYETADYDGLLQGAVGGAMMNGPPPSSSNRHSPLGMELGEFLSNGDLDFLNNHSFAFNRVPAP